MSVYSTTIPYATWTSYAANPTYQASVQKNANNSAVQNGQTDAYVSYSGETCTDGKDDGKIGFGSAIWNTIKGIGKTAVNMVKGCFTNSEGKFSLGKTLLSIGTAALCVAFPAVGLVACGIGAVAGAVQVGKGIYSVATADTDAEAKEAWQNIGGGALTTGLSVVGAKASYASVKATSSATNGLSSVSKDASILTKGKALWADMKSSTVNQFGKIKSSVTSSLSTSKKVKADVKKLNKMKKANADALAKQAKGETLSEAELKAISDWENLSASDFSEAALKKVNKQNTFEALKAELKEAKGSKNKAAIEEAKVNLNEFKESNPNILKRTTNNVKSHLTKGFDDIDSAAEAFKMKKLDVTSAKFSKLKSNIYDILKDKGIDLHSPIKSTITRLKVEEPALYDEYGYQNILEVLKVISGERLLDQSI